VQVSDGQFGAYVEPAVAVNPRNPRNLLAASRVVQGKALDLATYASFDGGLTWQGNGILPGSALGDDGNVTVTFDQAGHGYVSGLVTRSTAGGGGPEYVWRTDDGGRHFGPPVLAMRGNTDHSGLAADPTAGSSDLYLAGIVFQGSAGKLRFTRSADSGRSFEPARSIDPSDSPDDRLTVVAAGPDGTTSSRRAAASPSPSPPRPTTAPRSPLPSAWARSAGPRPRRESARAAARPSPSTRAPVTSTPR